MELGEPRTNPTAIEVTPNVEAGRAFGGYASTAGRNEPQLVTVVERVGEPLRNVVDQTEGY